MLVLQIRLGALCLYSAPHHLHLIKENVRNLEKLKRSDEGMPNRPSIFAYLVFGPGEIP
jgi:hypothetical protein